MAGLRSTVTVLVVALSAFIYYRLPMFAHFYHNAPQRLQHVNRPSTIEVKFQDVVRNCEDVLVHESEQWALLSCDPGRDHWNTVLGPLRNHTAPSETGLYLWKYTDKKSKPVQLKLKPFNGGRHPDFHPLGVDYHGPSKTLFVVNHASTASKVERFKLDVKRGEATHLSTIEGGAVKTPNSIAAISDTEFFVTNDHHFKVRDNLRLAQIETYLSIPGGSVAHVQLLKDGGFRANTLARLPFANGIALLNDTTLAVASSSTMAVSLYTVAHEPAGPILTLATKIALPFIPDNLSVDGRGKLLIAGHPHAPSIEKVGRNNGFCQDRHVQGDEQCQLNRLSWVSEWSPEQGLEHIYVGSDFGTSTTAARDAIKGIGFVSGLYERGILVWRE